MHQSREVFLDLRRCQERRRARADAPKMDITVVVLERVVHTGLRAGLEARDERGRVLRIRDLKERLAIHRVDDVVSIRFAIDPLAANEILQFAGRVARHPGERSFRKMR